MPLKQSIQPQIPGADRSVQKFASDIAQAIDNRRVEVRVSAGTESVGVIPVTLQVIDRLNRNPISGRWLIRFWISETEWGEPGGSQDVGITTGTLVSNDGDQIIEAATDDGGELVFDLEVATTGNRYVHIANLEELASSGQVAMVGGGTVGAGGGAFAPDDAEYVLGSSDGDLPNGLVLTAGSNVTITPGAGTITIAASAGGTSFATVMAAVSLGV